MNRNGPKVACETFQNYFHNFANVLVSEQSEGGERHLFSRTVIQVMPRTRTHLEQFRFMSVEAKAFLPVTAPAAANRILVSKSFLVRVAHAPTLRSFFISCGDTQKAK